MRPEKKIREELMFGIGRTRDDYNQKFDEYAKRVKSAKNVEEMMVAKLALLLAMVENMPFGTANCYFCHLHVLHIHHGISCDNCQWAKYHGQCTSKNGGYQKIQYYRNQLKDVIGALYYRGEKYKKIERKPRSESLI